ncbi:uncharacterized protein OCT59_017866 [Rhizophagus irregularis]|uniref:Uncharacterized protein n=2 Tax=Rhizophagus irregularis TaxID=588596 RepID=A0A015MXU5_RHIIW|nr:hypothetical protein RirG_076810 [Rhizophagus irregularis DAOM 197198w]UZO25601.1 hypothetical protein OCT59_017866 [Rhizophagus irregularis]GBC46849.1 kinase-like domain-containing protein [Rhizophagus irregularis DAOM 181602=DAOM 197198]
MNKGNEAQVPIESEFNNLNILDKDSNSMNIDHKNCPYCNKSFTKELWSIWCKECDPFMNIEGWSSGNNEIDKLIKDTIYDARNENRNFPEWVPSLQKPSIFINMINI